LNRKKFSNVLEDATNIPHITGYDRLALQDKEKTQVIKLKIFNKPGLINKVQPLC